MKLAQLSLALPAGASRVEAREAERARVGPRRVTPAAGLEADPNYALQELLNAVQEMAQGPFQGEEQVHQAALALAADLGKLGPEATRLLRHGDERPLPAWNRLDLEA